MGLLSCLAVGLAFVVAVGLLLFAAVLLGWCVPAAVERGRGTRPPPPEVGRSPAEGPASAPPSAPPAESDRAPGR